MNRRIRRHSPDAREDGIARRIAQYLYDDVVALTGRDLPADGAFVRRYLRDPHHAPPDQPHDLILVLAPRDWSGAMVAQLRAFGLHGTHKHGHDAR